jgi:hypothetical protein
MSNTESLCPAQSENHAKPSPVRPPLCTHRMTTGATCGSPAVSGTALCYHHSAIKTALGKVAPLDRVPYGAHSPIPFVFPEDRASLQINFFLLLQAFNERRIDQRTSTIMHRMLRSMSANLGTKPLADDKPEPQPSEAAASAPTPAEVSDPIAANQHPEPGSTRKAPEPARNTVQKTTFPPASQSPIEPSSVFSVVTPAPSVTGYPSNQTTRQPMGALSPEGQRILALFNDRP